MRRRNVKCYVKRADIIEYFVEKSSEGGKKGKDYYYERFKHRLLSYNFIRSILTELRSCLTVSGSFSGRDGIKITPNSKSAFSTRRADVSSERFAVCEINSHVYCAKSIQRNSVCVYIYGSCSANPTSRKPCRLGVGVRFYYCSAPDLRDDSLHVLSRHRMEKREAKRPRVFCTCETCEIARKKNLGDLEKSSIPGKYRREEILQILFS